MASSQPARGGATTSRAAAAGSTPVASDGGGRRADMDTSRGVGKTDTAESASRPGLTIVAGAARVGETSAVKKVVLNELLTYINVYRNRSNADALRQVVLGFYSPGDIMEGKKVMVQELQSVEGVGQFTTERRNSTVRPAHEAELDDLLGIFDAADAKQALDGLLFVASKLALLPKFGPEEINLGVVVDRQVKMESSINNLSLSVQQLATSGPAQSDASLQQSLQSIARDMDRRLGDFNAAVSDRLDHLQAVCSQLTESVVSQSQSRSPPQTLSSSPRQQQQQESRSMNIVVFGVAEDRVATVWRQKLDQALQFVCGQTVDVVDAFRVGRYVNGKVRPIVVKLRTAWDRRIILANSSKLKNYGERIFISPDESLEIRRKKMLDRIKTKAESDGKVVLVSNGMLSVDGVDVFSLKDGKLVRDD